MHTNYYEIVKQLKSFIIIIVATVYKNTKLKSLKTNAAI